MRIHIKHLKQILIYSLWRRLHCFLRGLPQGAARFPERPEGTARTGPERLGFRLAWLGCLEWVGLVEFGLTCVHTYR